MTSHRRVVPLPSDGTHWTLDKRIPLALIFAMLTTFASVMIYVSTLKGQTEENSRRITMLEAQRVGERLSRLETQAEINTALLTRMDDKLTRLIERPRGAP